MRKETGLTGDWLRRTKQSSTFVKFKCSPHNCSNCGAELVTTKESAGYDECTGEALIYEWAHCPNYLGPSLTFSSDWGYQAIDIHTGDSPRNQIRTPYNSCSIINLFAKIGNYGPDYIKATMSPLTGRWY